MKKITIFILTLVTALALAGCADKKSYDDSINVYFFTANQNASLIDTIFGLEPGDKVPEPEEEPTYLGHEFVGWYKDIKKTEPWLFDEDTVGTKSFILYAKWLAVGFPIVYELNGGEMPEVYPEFFKNDKATILVPPVRRVGYSFLGWYLYPWKNEDSTKPGDLPIVETPLNLADTLYLHAHWKRVVSIVTFYVNYPEPTGGPATPGSISATYDTRIRFPNLRHTPEYRFVGWNSQPDGSGEAYVNGELFKRTQRTKAYAQWEPR